MRLLAPLRGRRDRSSIPGRAGRRSRERLGRLRSGHELDEDWPFEIDQQARHLFKHPGLRLDDIGDVSSSEPLFYPAGPPAHWLMVAEIAGRILTVPLAPSHAGDPHKRRPIDCYVAADHLARRYRKDRRST